MDRPTLESHLAMLRADGHPIATGRAIRARYDPAWPSPGARSAGVTARSNRTIRMRHRILDPAAIVFGGAAPFDLRARIVAAASASSESRWGRPVPRPPPLVSRIDRDPRTLGAALMPIRQTPFDGGTPPVGPARLTARIAAIPPPHAVVIRLSPLRTDMLRVRDHGGPTE